MLPGLSLRPFTDADLPLVEAWFTDGETMRWLGGPNWPRQMLELARRPLGEFRGARETGRYRWLAREGDEAVGYIDCGTYDRWTTWEGGPGGRGVVGVLDVASAALTFVVDPRRRGRGVCPRMLAALMDLAELAPIQLFAAGVEVGNARSIRCLQSAGFAVLDPTPDWEGILYYVRRRPARAA